MDIKNYLSAGSTDPKKILKAVLGFAVVMLVLWLVMVSRMDFQGGGGDVATQAAQERADSLRSAISGNEPRMRQTSEEEAPNIFFNAFTTFLVLITLLGLVWIWSRMRDSSSSSAENKRIFNELGGHVLGQGASLKIVEINEEIWVMGITEGSVNLLHRYSKEEWSEEIEKDIPRETSFYKMFKGEKK